MSAAGLRARRGLGQHFLVDPGILARIVDASGVGPSDRVLEVGTGPATLTQFLAERAERVVTFEVDPAMAAFAREELAGHDNVEVVEADVLERKSQLSRALRRRLEGLGAFRLVANLPYSIATPLLVEMVAAAPGLRSATVLVQREVAERLTARPGSKRYGPAGLLVAFWATVERRFDVAAGSFAPPPKVRSTVVRIERRPRPLGRAPEFERFRVWVRALFQQRRKQLGGLLGRICGSETASEALKWIETPGSARVETLSAEDVLELSRRLPEPES